MGELCSRPREIIIPKNRISQEVDLIFTPSSFVKENFGSFYQFYTLDNRALGAGAWGEVRKCYHKVTNETRVVKIILKAGIPQYMIDNKTAFREAEILKKLDHPNLPRIYEFFEDSTSYFIVIEYCKGGDLFDRITKLLVFSESQAKEIISQVLLAVNYLHSKGIVHRDLKPENILMSDEESLSLKVVDFDTASVSPHKRFKKIYGTPLYMAPEVVKGRYNEKCDLWSCGIILYILLKGGPPYDGTEGELFKTLKSMKKFELKGHPWTTISPQLLDLLKNLLEPDYNKRISASEACIHPCFQNSPSKVSDQEVLQVLSNIQNFKKTSKLKEAIHIFIITQIADPSLFKTEEAVFNLLDINKDGAISMEELIRLMTTRGVPLEEAEMYADLIMEQADSDNSGFIDYTEFLRASVTKNKFLTKENIFSAFSSIDLDKSGSIEFEELKELICGGMTTKEELISDIIRQADRNEDGKIDLYEFEALLLENITKRRSSLG